MFELNINTKIKSEIIEKPVELAISRFYRYLEMTLEHEIISSGEIHIQKDQNMEDEEYQIIVEEQLISIRASESLGCIYGLNHISQVYLKIQPFWFWNDQIFIKQKAIEIPIGTIVSTRSAYRFRGWFVNDEVLLNAWNIDGDEEEPWKMVMESLLLLKGNTIIPGTDQNSKKYANMAADMGLYITHHHAEPLGAEMFSRAYPQLVPAFDLHPEKFRFLWEEGVKKQANKKVIWNIGFRGQGDCPFWLNDDRYVTDESRGKLLSSVMDEQRKIVEKYVKNPVFCTNLYGETVDLFQKGLMEIPKDTIKIWADNGYGKMVSRRQELENPRNTALPREESKHESHGVYYHASFYDLQAASHITMLPNSIDMIQRELQRAYERGISDLILVNCSNIKPHVYVLQAIAAIWNKGELDVENYSKIYANGYFENKSSEIAKLFQSYSDYAPRYGNFEDEGCGDQFYNYSTRQFICQWLLGDTKNPLETMKWVFYNETLKEQIIQFETICNKAMKQYDKACQEIDALIKELDTMNALSAKQLLEDSIGLQYSMYYHFALGSSHFCKAFHQYFEQNYKEAFFSLGQAKEAYETANFTMRNREHGKWKGFYQNDCLTDVKQTAYWLGILMGMVRAKGDGPYFYQWQRDELYAPEDRKVVLITNFENHLTNEELYQIMRKNRKVGI